jgi:hypothetical protein
VYTVKDDNLMSSFLGTLQIRKSRKNILLAGSEVSFMPLNPLACCKYSVILLKQANTVSTIIQTF